MKFHADKKIFQKSLKTAIACCPGKVVVPILQNVLIESDIETNTVTLTCYNLEQFLRVSFEADVTDNGRLTINAKKLSALLSELTDPWIEICSDENTSASIVCGSAKATLPMLAADDFPLLPNISDVTEYFAIASAKLKKNISCGSYACDAKENRIALQGMCIEITGNTITGISTDGKRMALSCTKLNHPIAINPQSHIIHQQALGIMVNLPGDELTIGFTDKIVVVKGENFVFFSKLLDAAVPNYQRVIPTTPKFFIKVDAGRFMAKDRLASLCMPDTRGVELLLKNGEIQFKCENCVDGTITDSIEVLDSNCEKETTLLLNAMYILEAFRICAQDEVTIAFDDNQHPCIFEFGNDNKAIITPLRQLNINKEGK